jgi:MFS family permease
VSLLAALPTVGSLSDYIGRRPAIMAALALNIVAMVMFVAADSAGALIAARAVQASRQGSLRRRWARRSSIPIESEGQC